MKLRVAIALSATLSITFISPYSFAAKKVATKDIVINVVGDIHGESAIKREAIPSLKKYFAGGNLNIFNLETAVTTESKKEVKEYNFKTDVAFLKSIRAIGLNVASIANNHSYDFGAEGFLDTMQNLDKAGISYVGGGINSGIAYQGEIFTIKGLKIGLLGIAKVNGGPASIASNEKPGTTNGYDRVSTEHAITSLKKVSDVVILLVHWGEEGSFCPRSSEISSARKWQSLGADIIIGSHTHTLQPVVLEQNKLVAYSMGNFIFYSSKLENRSTGILKIRISPKKRISYTMQPFTINNLTKVPERSELMPAAFCPSQAKTTVR
ncbi:PgsA Putative enzyme of poly-gamma-glutamate biosynthesis (capsule formation) [Candidatus Nanopelagicaceae bacterium]